MQVDAHHVRWYFGSQDVTCQNCHTAMYKPDADDALCPTCMAAAGQDVIDVQAHIGDVVAKRFKRRHRPKAR